MRSNFIAVLVGGVVATASVASAAVYSDDDIYNQVFSEGESRQYLWSYGPIGSGEAVTKVETWLWFSSQDRDAERVHIVLGVGDGFPDFSYTSGLIQFGSSLLGSWTFTSGDILNDAQNGFLSFSISAPNVSGLLNDFTFTRGRIEVTTASQRTVVPDGGASAAFLVVGLLGVLGLTHRISG